MLINSQTKIAALIKHHPDALEAIVSLSPEFKKLRNPILRKLMAGRTSIAMASKIGACNPADFFNVLRPLGFVTDDLAITADGIQLSNQSLKRFIKDIEHTQIISLDVRPMLSEGNDPLKIIQQHIRNLKPGQVLKIINTFEPSPLIELLSKQGFGTYADRISTDLIETYFYKKNGNEKIKVENLSHDHADWDGVLKNYEGKIETIDVRHLEMPAPMITILEKLETLDSEKALHVHHKRVPVFLLNELKDRNFEYRINEISESEVYLLIFKK